MLLFRQSGALFAGNFKDSSVSIEDWVELTQSGLHQYLTTWQVLRNNPLLNYDRLSTEGIPIYTIMHNTS